MVNKFGDAIKISISAYKKQRALLSQKLGNESINHFKDSFRKGGFTDEIFVPWKKRKGNRNPSRSILVKSGRLRRSFEYYPTLNRITVINDTPYGVYHNNGGQWDVGSRILSFKRVDKLVNIRGKKTVKMGLEFSKASRATSQMKVNIGSVTMPKRQFMGESNVLNEKFGVIIMRMIKRAL